jgi:oligopeptide transport system permease protein
VKIFSEEKYTGLSPESFQVVNIDKEIVDTKFNTKPISFFEDVIRRFAKNKLSVVAFVLICIIVVFAIIGPSLNPYTFDEQNLELINLPAKISFISGWNIFNGSRVVINRRADLLDDPNYYNEGSVLEVMNKRLVNDVEMVDVLVDYYIYEGIEEDDHWFGTDYLGRDSWTRLWRGVRVSLLIAIVSVMANVFIGIVYGAIAGYYGGKVDMIMMRISEIIKSFPRIVIITMFILVFGTGLFSIVGALVVKGWVNTARMVRSQFYRFKNSEYVLAAKTLGVQDFCIMFRHILPNSIGPVITYSMIAIPSAIFAESFLAYIGLGLQAPEPSIGVLLAQGQKVLLQYPEQTLFPALLISVLMISFNMFANGLRDAFDPTQRGE